MYDSSFVNNYIKKFVNSSPTNDKEKVGINHPTAIKNNQNLFKKEISQVS